MPILRGIVQLDFSIRTLLKVFVHFTVVVSELPVV